MNHQAQQGDPVRANSKQKNSDDIGKITILSDGTKKHASSPIHIAMDENNI